MLRKQQPPYPNPILGLTDLDTGEWRAICQTLRDIEENDYDLFAIEKVCRVKISTDPTLELIDVGGLKGYDYFPRNIVALVKEWAIATHLTHTLIQLIEEGPVEDGDLISKQERDAAIRAKLACRVIVKGQDGYQAARPRAVRLYMQRYGGLTLQESIVKARLERTKGTYPDVA